METSIERMRVAASLAWRSNPVSNAYCVGCLLVDRATDCIVATGFSREMAGNTHAEEVALEKLTASTARAAGSSSSSSSIDSAAEASAPTPPPTYDMYTTMEPCSVRLSGNTTCADRIIADGRIARVFVGVLEPAALVVCEGVAKLRAAGVEVVSVEEFLPPMKPPMFTALDETTRVVRPLPLRQCCLAPNAHVVSRARFRVRRVYDSDYDALKRADAGSATCATSPAVLAATEALAERATAAHASCVAEMHWRRGGALVRMVVEATLPTKLPPPFGGATKEAAAETTPVVLLALGVGCIAVTPPRGCSMKYRYGLTRSVYVSDGSASAAELGIELAVALRTPANASAAKAEVRTALLAALQIECEREMGLAKV